MPFKIIIPFFTLWLYFYLNYYLIFRFANLFWYKSNIVLTILTILICALFPLASYLLSNFNNGFTKILYFVASVWLGVFMISIFSLLGFEIINLLSKKLLNFNLLIPKVWIILTILIISIVWYSLWNASLIKTRNINLKLDNLQKNTKIVYLSDIHIDTINSMDYLEKIINQINNLSGDLVIINWDIVHIGHFADQQFNILSKIKAPSIFTYWNHEAYFGKQKVNNILKWSNLKILENEMIDLDWIQIIWLQNIGWIDDESNKKTLDKLLKKFEIDKNKASILVLHEPIWPEISKKHWINLQLWWHTHNWQVFPFNLFVKIWFKYIYWLYDLGWMYVYISSGAWTWWPPMRLGSNSEIVVFNLSK